MRGDAREVLSPGPQLGTSRRTLQKELWEAELGLRESKRKAGNERESRGRISTDCRVTSAQSPQPPSLQAQPEVGKGKKVTAHSCPFPHQLKPCALWPSVQWQRGPWKNAWTVPKQKTPPPPDNGRCHPAPGTPNPKWPTPAE